ncbi:hypothetical protein Tco_0009459 [Tanacetum coccineum]
MLDKADFASWQQRIRLYCRGKENGVNILKSIDEGPFQMGTTRGIIAEGTEGPINLGPERPRVYSELSQDEKDRIVTAVKLNKGLKDSNFDQLYAYLMIANMRQCQREQMMLERFLNNRQLSFALRVVVQNVQGRQNRGQGNNARGAGAVGYGRAQNRVGNANPGQARQLKRNRVVLDEEQLLFLAGDMDNAIDEDVDDVPRHKHCSWLIIISRSKFMMKAVGLYVSDVYHEVRTKIVPIGIWTQAAQNNMAAGIVIGSWVIGDSVVTSRVILSGRNWG